tara:strand:- start:44 stop:208 length:165 start_codon:yes stop_codon:yes gene_type:complete
MKSSNQTQSFALNSNIFEAKVREVINQTSSLSWDSKAHILICLEEELRKENGDL